MNPEMKMCKHPTVSWKIESETFICDRCFEAIPPSNMASLWNKRPELVMTEKINTVLESAEELIELIRREMCVVMKSKPEPEKV